MRTLTSLLTIILISNLFAFQVQDKTPASQSLSSNPDQEIVIYFDDLLDMSTVNASSVMLFGRWSGPAELSFEIGGFGNALTITATEEFFAGEYVMVQLSNTLASIDGDLLDHGHAFGFWIRTLPGSLDLIDVGHLEVRQDGETFIQCYGAYAGDLDNDGWGDLTVVNEDAEDMRVFMSDQGSYSTFSVQDLPFGNKPSSNEGADFNGDGEIDLVIGNTQGDMISVVMGNGDGTFGEEVIYDAAQGVRGVTIIDFEGDGDMDIASANRQGSNISFFVNDGSGVFSDGGAINTSLSSETAIIAADMNEDGIMDLVVGGYVSDEIAVLLNDGEGNFTVEDIVDTEDGPWMITMGDVNGDGHVDIASANSGSNMISVHLGDGEGNLSAPDNMFTDGFPLAIDLGDLDGDGDLDVISSNYAGGTYTLYENMGTGEYDNPRTMDAEIAGSCAIFHDRNNDGVMDITGIDELADVLIFFENQATGLEDIELLEIQISPNPFTDDFTLDLGEIQGVTELALIDSKGVQVATKTISSFERRLSWAPELSAGRYILMDILNNRRLAVLIKH